MAFPLEIKRTGRTRVTRGGGGKGPGGPPPPASGAQAPALPDGGGPSGSGAEAAYLERDATRVVRQAASVLEQELSAGIAAAQRIEARFLNVQQLRQRGQDQEEVTQRFRHDAHEVVDLVFDVITVAVDKAASLANAAERRLLAGRSPSRAPRQLQAAPPRQGVPTLSPPQPLLPGQTAELVISVENDGGQPTKTVTFTASDLVNGVGGAIAGANVTCVPNDLVLGPRGVERVAVRIHVPKDAAPGTYCGMFQANGLPTVRAVMVVEVRGAA